MKKTMVLLMIVTLIFVGCANTEESILDEQIAQALNQGKENSKEREDGQELPVIEVDQTNVDLDPLDWPKELKDLPEFIWGDINNIHRGEDVNDGIKYIDYTMDLVNVKEDSADDYAEKMDKAGYRRTFGPEYIEIGLTNTVSLQYEYDLDLFDFDDRSYKMSIMFWTNDKGGGAIFISIPLKPDGSLIVDEDKEEDEDDNSGPETMTMELSDGTLVTVVEGQLPPGFPLDDVPIYDGQVTAELGETREMEGMTIYMAIFYSNDPVEKVIERSGELLLDKVDAAAMDMTMEGIRTLMVEYDGYQVTLMVGSDSDVEAEAFISYSIIFEE